MAQVDLLGDVLKILEYQQRKKQREFEQGREFDLRTRAAEAVIEAQKEQTKAERDRIKLEERRTKVDEQARKALNEQFLQNWREKVAIQGQTGALLNQPGVQAIPIRGEGTGGAPFTPAPSMEVTDPRIAEIQYNLPTPSLTGEPTKPTTFTALSPTKQTTALAGLADITKASERGHEVRMTKLEKEADFLKSEMERIYGLEQTRLTQTAQNERARLDRKSREDQTRARVNATIEAAKIRANRAANEVDIDLVPLVENSRKGNISDQELNRMQGLSERQKGAIRKSVYAGGGNFYTDEQKALIGLSGGLSNLITNMDNLITAQVRKGTAGGKVGALGKGIIQSIDTDITDPEDLMIGMTTLAARVFAKEVGSTSKSDEDRVKGMFPKRFNPAESNIFKRNDFVRKYKDAIRNKLKGLSESQIHDALGAFGLNDVNDNLTINDVRNKIRPGSSPTKIPSSPTKQITPVTPEKKPSAFGAPVKGGKPISARELEQLRNEEWVPDPNKRYRITSTTGETRSYNGADPTLIRTLRNLKNALVNGKRINALASIVEE